MRMRGWRWLVQSRRLGWRRGLGGSVSFWLRGGLGGGEWRWLLGEGEGGGRILCGRRGCARFGVCRLGDGR